ncbi:ATP synthase subunits region ORF 7-like [Saccostrea cucullata]|uniref:ATP synthase subunits region ORF 7-like n=1 Tax=Saccostrea cuccullata TaxID=36930 RepID=UPI002ED2209E
MEKTIAEMTSTIKTLKTTIEEMKSFISSLQRDISNRKEFRCESGVSRQHKFPAPTWPYGQTIKFKTAFQEIPTVTYGLYVLDSDYTVNLRISTVVKEVTRTGFSVKIKTWENSVLYGARISWMACGR